MGPLKFFPEENTSICLFFKFFGFFPYSKSNCITIFLIILSLFYIAVGPCMLVDILFFPRSTDYESKIDETAEYFMLVGYVMSQMISNGQALFTSRIQQKLYKMFNGIDYLILRLDQTKDYSAERHWIFIKLFLIAFISLVVPVTQIIKAYRSDSKTMSLLFFLPLLRLRCIQFMFFTDNIKIKLTVLNEQVVKINLRNPNADRNIVTSDFFNDVKSIDYILSKIYVMKTIHGKVWRTAETINDCFGLSLLFIISHCFATLTVEAYWCYFSFFGKNPLSMAIGEYGLYTFYNYMVYRKTIF